MAKSGKKKEQKLSSDAKVATSMLAEAVRAELAKNDASGNPITVEITLVSGSMSPFLPTGAVARIQRCTYDELRFLDIVVYRAEERLICHCVFGKDEFRAANGERTLITRGLQNPMSDDPVRESDVVGKVVSHSLTKSHFLMIYAIYRLRRFFRLRRKV